MNKPYSWLDTFQSQFSATLRQPLDSSSGTFKSSLNPSHTPQSLQTRPSRGGLGVYQKLYWLRLFNVLQNDYPVTTWVVRPWHFNHVAQEYLLANPPAEFDIGSISFGFVDFLESERGRKVLMRHTPQRKPEMVLEAAKIDLGFLRTLLTSNVTYHHSEGSPLENLESGGAHLKLKLINGVYLQEQWPLIKIKMNLENPHFSELKNQEIPKKLDKNQSWCLFSKGGSIHLEPLSEHQYTFYRLLETHTLGDTLSAFVLGLKDYEPAELNQDIYQWMNFGAKHGLWKQETP